MNATIIVALTAVALSPLVVWGLAELFPPTFRRAVRWLRMGLHL